MNWEDNTGAGLLGALMTHFHRLALTGKADGDRTAALLILSRMDEISNMETGLDITEEDWRLVSRLLSRLSGLCPVEVFPLGGAPDAVGGTLGNVRAEGRLTEDGELRRTEDGHMRLTEK